MKKEGNASKIYLMIVEKIRDLIEENGLGPGDRLPSERELSDTLKVGRSSVREAFRSLELLGLIETRKGEGTFISDFRNHRLVEILSKFILNNKKSRDDVIETKEMLELAGLLLLIRKKGKIEPVLFENVDTLERDVYFKNVFQQANNRLLYKIWHLVTNFKNTIHDEDSFLSARTLKELTEALNKGAEHQVLKTYYLHFLDKQ